MTPKQKILVNIIKVENSIRTLVKHIESPDCDVFMHVHKSGCKSSEPIDVDALVKEGDFSAYKDFFSCPVDVLKNFYNNSKKQLNHLYFDCYVPQMLKDNKEYIFLKKNIEEMEIEQKESFVALTNEIFSDLNEYVSDRCGSNVGINIDSSSHAVVGIIKKVTADDHGVKRNSFVFGHTFDIWRRYCCNGSDEFEINYGSIGSFNPKKDCLRAKFLQVLSSFANTPEWVDFIGGMLTSYKDEKEKALNKLEKARTELEMFVENAGKNLQNLPLYSELFDNE